MSDNSNERFTSLSEVVTAPVLDDVRLVIAATDGSIVTLAVTRFGVGIWPVDVGHGSVGLRGGQSGADKQAGYPVIYRCDFRYALSAVDLLHPGIPFILRRDCLAIMGRSYWLF